VVEYYLAVGPAVLSGIRDRPTNLERYPDGITGEAIYQKRLPRHAPDWLHTATVTFPSGRTADTLRVCSVADVVWAASQGTITLHPWPVRAPDTDHPDELRLDLDPQPGTDFADARRVALDVVRPLLDELGYRGVPKTSGGRGVHVDVRLEPRWTFTDVRRAAIALGREIERRAPDAVTTAWWKEQRGERVFIDYNQNARDRTVAAAWSVRARRDATVSTPVSWDDLAAVEPEDCTVRTVPALLAERGDPRAVLDEVPASLAAALELAERDAAAGLPDLPYPPSYPKMPGEPKRVQPSRDRDRDRGGAAGSQA
jgi:DNA ligase D-like protein (predicted polymerase)